MAHNVEPVGVGLQYNPGIVEWFPFDRLKVSALEILLDTIMGPLDSPYQMLPGKAEQLKELGTRFRLIAHSNYGCDFGFLPIEETPAVRRHVALAQALESPWVTNHCFYGDGSWSDVWSSPIQFSPAELRRLAARAKEIQSLYGIPLLHENAAYYMLCPGSELEEARFLADLTEQADTYLMLDLHNIYANSINHSGYDADEFLNIIPLERVIEIHLGGGTWNEDFYHDWHDAKVPEPVWDLLQRVLERAPVAAVILEFQGKAHDTKTRALSPAEDTAAIEHDLQRAQQLWQQVYGQTPEFSRLRTVS